MAEEQGTASDGLAVSPDANAPDATPSESVADQAHSGLNVMMDRLNAEYDHPHHRGRLEQIESHVKMLHGLVDELPLAEANRKHHAGELLDAYRKRNLPLTMPHHDDELLAQELERMGEEA